MKKKINFQLMLIAIIAIFSTMILVSVICYNLFRKQILEDLKTYAHLLEDTEALSDLIEKKYDSRMDKVRITVVDRNGDVLYESDADAEKMDNHANRPEIIRTLAEGEGQAIRRSSTMGKSTFYYAIMTEDGNIIRVAKEADSIWSIFAGALPAIIAFIVLIILLCTVIAHVLTKILLEPIEKVAKNVDRLEELETYEELAPFVAKIKKQHEDILKNAGMRQEFTANVSHELKTPLTSISGYSELIESGMASDEDIMRFARKIHHNSNRLLTLINDVIRLSELDVVDRDEPFEVLNLSEIAETCVNMLQINAENHGVTLEFRGIACTVHSEKQMLEELVYNLCDNAIRYNNKGGKVTVSVAPADGKAVLTVEDTGIGIPKEHQERIFERFYRVDKSRSKSTGGTGLGLAIVKHIVAKNQAEMKLESEAGKGTKISVFFKGEDNGKGDL
ncbi:MAG: two-component sensor histidine kinase [Clostridiales bacterium]|nr:two-component sensor histidine kinase [Clostridiales bacterium]